MSYGRAAAAPLPLTSQSVAKLHENIQTTQANSTSAQQPFEKRIQIMNAIVDDSSVAGTTQITRFWKRVASERQSTLIARNGSVYEEKFNKEALEPNFQFLQFKKSSA